MKRKRLALLLALAMTVTSLPANSLMVSAAEETDGFIAGDESSVEVESSEDAAEGFAVEDAEPATSEAETDAFESADAEDGFTSAEGAAETEADFQAAEETQETEELISPESITIEPGIDRFFEVALYGRVEFHSGARATDGSELTYQWYSYGWNENLDSKVPIEGATSSVYVVESAERSKQYYCVATDADGNTSGEYFNVHVRTIDFERENNDDYENLSVKVHGQVVLKSAAYSLIGNSLKYQWGKWNEEKHDFDEIEGANEATFVIDDAQEYGYYRCRISDDNYEHGEWFYVTIDSGLKCEDGENYVWKEAEIGESLTLKTTAVADEGVALSYQWYKLEPKDEYSEFVAIPGETKPEFTTGALNKREEYCCKVLDQYGNILEQHYMIQLKDTLQIEGGNSRLIKIAPNGTAELSVSASSKLTDKLSYRWYRVSDDESDDVEFADNKDKTSLKVENVERSVTYYCQVYDGNEYEYVHFRIQIDTGLEVEYGSDSSYYNKVDYGKPVTMEVSATANEGVEITYQWYEIDENWDEILIPGATQKSYTIDRAEESKNYNCIVTDSYGNSIGREFCVEVRRILADTYGKTITIEPGEDVELSVSATSIAGEKLTYQWYKMEKGQNNIPIEGATSDKLLVSGLKKDTTYCCVISDEKTSVGVDFYVKMDSCIVFKDVETYIEEKAGSKVVLDAEAFAEDGNNLTYQWQKGTIKYDEDGDDYYEYELIQNATTPTYEVTVEDSRTQYLCQVTDSNGVSASLEFSVGKKSGVSDEESKIIYVTIGESTTLTTTLTEIDGGKLTYQWFYYNEDKESYVPVTGATTASCKTENITERVTYYCEASNGKDCNQQYFYVRPDSGYSVDMETDNHIFVKSGAENVVLKVSAKSNFDLSYEWYEFKEEEDDGYWSELVGVTGNSYTIDRVTSESMRYRCTVWDKYNSTNIWFEVSAEPDIGFSSVENVWVPKGTTATLNANAIGGANCTKMTYKWYRFAQDSDFSWVELPNGDKASYTTDAVNELQKYRCVLADDYGCRTFVEMLVGPEELKAKAAVDPDAAITLVPGNRTKVVTDFSGTYKFYKFVPDRSGIWQIMARSNMVTSAWLYDDQMNELSTSNVGSWHQRSFNIQYSLEKGKTYYLKCGRDYYYSAKSFLIEANFVKEDVHEHKWNAGTVKTAATCAKAGVKVYTCSTCGQTKEETIPATGKHNMVTKIDKAATCGAAGSQHKECSVCGKKDAATAIPATGKHSFGDYKVTKAPTVLAAGVKTRTCKVCGKTETAAVAKLNGTIKVISAKVPLQLKKSIALSSLVTGLTTGDSINAAACTSSKPAVAAISGGKVVAKKVGTTVVTVKLASGTFANVTINVQKKAVATTAITIPGTLKLTVGGKATLAPVISPITTTDKVSFTSSNSKVATVSKTGVVTAKKSGTATIKIKSGKKTKNVKVTVAKKAPTGMTGVPASKTLKKGKSFTIKPKLTPSGAEATIKYTSSNKSIATVTSKGKVTAKKPGKATITVKAGNVTKTCVVTVKK